MSYNPTPKWTEDIILPELTDMKCPVCKVVSDGADEIFEDISGNPYYTPRHIPPKLTFTCFNEDCPHCDLDYYVELSCVVTATQSKLVTHN